jgi:CheY-like chemotaxis protein
VPHTLLLADDSVTIQRVIELTFADEDIRVVAVSDGDQAIARIDTELPDIVLVDIGMPGKSGYEVAEHVKQSPALKHIPVLLLTGAFEPVDDAKAADAGCDGILAKPFEPQLVIARVKELLARGDQGGPEPVATAADPDAGYTASAGYVEDDNAQRSKIARLDSYFAQLDAAFATLSTPAARPVDADPSQAGAEWLSTRASGESTDASASDHAPVEILTSPATDTETLPPFGDAFSAMLASEQHEPSPSEVRWPMAPPPAPTGNGTLSEETIEAIARRVLERLSDRVVRDTVANLVTETAERLVREEIERIKASMK